LAIELYQLKSENLASNTTADCGLQGAHSPDFITVRIPGRIPCGCNDNNVSAKILV
jgi:hypothetical protein